MKRIRKGAESQVEFINALRECLGLAPIPNSVDNSLKESQWWSDPWIDFGNRRNASKKLT